ncbi:uncharacterized protein N7498_009813 [Penicillium cinerascens]|uniref:Uncharacterized protein n=1 Tax=Penicillium cinerascens TaxID=70096 RepID=A0A9W9J591_9EURO|nr:uncharacterized protein N7498_009813 [Penicillium cinerascens]KAJ5190828.1 hypothetical protein N7498_009813 [Penicillium cinerascens]
MYIHVIFGSTVSGKTAIAINVPTDTVDRYIAITNDLIDFGALASAYSRPANDARHSERAIKTYAGAFKSIDILLAITEKLDKILDKFAISEFQATPDVAKSTDVSPMSVLTPNTDSFLTGGAGEIGALNLDDYENFDLMSWAIDFDLGNTANNWTMM